MSDVVWVAAIAAVPGTISALISFRNRNTLIDVKRNTDGLVAGRVESEGARGRAEGVSQERAEGAERAADVAVASAVVTAGKAAVDMAAAEQRTPMGEGPLDVHVVADETAPVTVKVVEAKE